MKGVTQESDEDPELTEDSLKPFISSELWRDVFDEQSAEMKSENLPAVKQETGNNNKKTKKLSKQVSWNDAPDVKNEPTDSADESSQEDDESAEDLNAVCDERSMERNICKCDSKEKKKHQYNETEKNDKAEERKENETKEKEKDVEPGKFDGVLSDTDDSDATAER